MKLPVTHAAAASLAFFVLAVGALAQETCPDDPLCPLAWLEGDWQGYGVFSGDTTYIRKSFRRELRGRVLVERTMDMFTPEQATADFEVHEDFFVYYPDGPGLRVDAYFVEGFAWHATLRLGARGDTVVVETDRVANGPPGSRARVTLVREGSDAFTSVFELGFGDQPLSVYERSRLRRMR